MAPNSAVADPAVGSDGPEDLRAFLDRCGGVRCGGGITVAHRVVAAQDAILGGRYPDDRSISWYVIAEESEASTAERVVMDLERRRLGRCYEAFWDRFGVAGSMPVVARSFSELLDRLAASDGAPYWSADQLDLGDAYD